MKRATTVDEMQNAFDLEPLESEEEMKLFYYPETMPVRTGNSDYSPIDVIMDSCERPRPRNIFLLRGHRGCGKSTELNRMSLQLQKKGFPVSTVNCNLDLDFEKLTFSSILIVIGEELFKMAKELGCSLEQATLDAFSRFWGTQIETETVKEAVSLSREIGGEAKTPDFFSSVLNIFARIKAEAQSTEDRITYYSHELERRYGEWTKLLNQLADSIADKQEQHQPIIIMEDLDKLTNERIVWDVFLTHARALTSFRFPVIYTFPIAFSYDPRFGELGNYYKCLLFPMMKVKTPQGDRYDDGIAAIRTIVEKRADPSLFEANVLDYLIMKTGGSLRDLFKAIYDAAEMARKKQKAISMERAIYALQMQRNDFSRLINDEFIPFLVDLHFTPYKGIITDSEKTIKMLQAGTILEYNGAGWRDLHPLVEDFLRDNGKLTRSENNDRGTAK